MKGLSKPAKYKHPRYKYRISYPDGKGGRAYKVFKTLAAADTYYEQNSPQATSAGLKVATLPEKNRREYIDAVNLLKPLGVSVFEAARVYVESTNALLPYEKTIPDAVEHFKKWNKAKEKSLTLSEAYKRYIDDLESEGKGAYHISSQKVRLKRFLEDFGTEHIVALIDANKVEKWIKNLKAIEIVEDKSRPKRNDGTYPSKRVVGRKAIQAKTKNNYRTALLAFFSYCKRKDYIQTNPIERVSKIKETASEPEIYTVEQLQNMLNLSPEKSDIRAFIAIGAFAGLRVTELGRLKWNKIDLSDKTITLDGTITKTSTRRVVNISDNLALWLEPYSDLIGKDRLVIESNFRKRFAEFLKNSKIAWIKNGLRHSSASYYLAKSKNEYETAQQMGHSINILKTHYLGLVKDSAAQAYWAIKP